MSQRVCSRYVEVTGNLVVALESFDNKENVPGLRHGE